MSSALRLVPYDLNSGAEAVPYMHLKRWLTGLIAAPFLVYIIGFGPRWLLHLILCIASLAGLFEYYALSVPHLSRFLGVLGFILTALLFVIFHMRQVLLLPVILSLWAMIPMVFYLFARPPGPPDSRTSELGKIVLGPVYIGLPLAMLVMVDLYPQGKIWIFFLLAVIFAGDTGAFYAGRSFGRHKLYERISPGKTWEGSIGGALLSLIIGIWFLRIFRIHPIDWKIVLLILGLNIAGQIGDLAESMLKRDHGVKDSGSLLPGHGGMLDRIDGLLFAVPLIYVFLSWPA